MEKINIAVDGFSSCGKSTIAKGLAKKLGYTYIDSGAMYRAVALFAYRNGWMTDTDINESELQKHISEIEISFETNPEGQQETYLNGENVEKEIRSLQIGNGASRVSTIGFVRRELVRQQQAMGKKKGVVMDGRDIGTVVLPHATVKIFLTAAPEARARRRWKEYQEKGVDISFEKVLEDVKQRDYQDTHREAAPLKQADDAVLLDTSELNFEQSLDAMKQIIASKV